MAALYPYILQKKILNVVGHHGAVADKHFKTKQWRHYYTELQMFLSLASFTQPLRRARGCIIPHQLRMKHQKILHLPVLSGRATRYGLAGGRR